MASHAGSFLVARPMLQDPSFRHSVVILLKHGKQGAFGLIVNRPAPVAGIPFELYSGGPCESEGFLMLHGHEEWIDTPAERPEREIAPGIFLGDSECLERLKELEDDAEARVRVFMGYAGWGPKQLEGELATGSWALVDATSELLFETPVDELWARLAPPRIPEPSVN